MPPGDHDTELAVLRLAWRLDSLDRWRERVDADLSEIGRKVDTVTRADEIAHAVAVALGDQRRRFWTWPKALLAGLGTISTLVAAQLAAHLLLGVH